LQTNFVESNKQVILKIDGHLPFPGASVDYPKRIGPAVKNFQDSSGYKKDGESITL
jgi:hypothetical protein